DVDIERKRVYNDSSLNIISGISMADEEIIKNIKDRMTPSCSD
ncbi:9203_t:CDS:1, partial [Acaulospora colombiana]